MNMLVVNVQSADKYFICRIDINLYSPDNLLLGDMMNYAMHNSS